MKKIRVRLKGRSYDIAIRRRLLKDCGTLIRRLDIGRDAVIITNRRLLKLYKGPLEKSLKRNAFTVRFEAVPDSEKAKSTECAASLINRISIYDRHKDIFIIAFGGGVVGDLAGFVASVYRRGIPYVQIPTTLLAQVDSAIGGKVAVDLAIAKNLVGAFYQPRMVMSDVSLLKTLSDRHVKNGLGEVIKYGVIKDRRLFEFLESDCEKILNLDEKALEYVVSRSSSIKAAIVAKDEFDKKGVRAALNYGHTIGHAIEAASSYSGQYNHGEAVAIGMIIAARISLRLGMIKMAEAGRIERLIEKAGLPTNIKGLKLSGIYAAYLHDKKFIHGKNRFILPVRIGMAKVVKDVPEDIIKDVIVKNMRGE